MPYQMAELEHCYGENIHILSNPYMMSLLARISRPNTAQPLLNLYFETLYHFLLEQTVNSLLPRVAVDWDTRMKEFNEYGVFRGEIIRPETRAVVVDLARAGTYPSHICYHGLNQLLDPHRVRQDHFYLNRATNEAGEVIGINATGSKIGGGQDDAYVLFPDPMGATGHSLCHCLDHYKKNVEGTAKKYIALHIIITPEYIKKIQAEHPDVEVITLRLDRGLSTEKALKSIPGTYPEEERGLTDNHYIVPGAGGVGEILNNSFV
jgi:uracil phosphoribosyltransferase